MLTRFFPRQGWRGALLAACALALPVVALFPNTVTAQGGYYQETKLVSDVAGEARFTDPNLVNSWGIAHSPSGPWRVADNGTGLVTTYLGDGTPQSQVITVPPPGGSPAGTTAAPTGNVYNPVNGSEPFDFDITANGRTGPAIFAFDTEDGTISGWNPGVDATNAILVVDRSKVGAGAVYKGLAYGRDNSGVDFLYAANFRFGTVEQFDNQFHLVQSFTDPQLANTCPQPGQCFAPFGIRNQGGVLVVTYALQQPGKHDDQAGPGNGFVDLFDFDGHLLARFASHGALNSPWGLTFAPSDFGPFSGAFLVGNFGDGRINAFNPNNGAFLGPLRDSNGNPITINGLWGTAFGNDGQAGAHNQLFFASGLNDEANGLFGRIDFVFGSTPSTSGGSATSGTSTSGAGHETDGRFGNAILHPSSAAQHR
jgi:uncharacterized protein (TIGR03118 family)